MKILQTRNNIFFSLEDIFEIKIQTIQRADSTEFFLEASSKVIDSLGEYLIYIVDDQFYEHQGWSIELVSRLFRFEYMQLILKYEFISQDDFYQSRLRYEKILKIGNYFEPPVK